MSRMVYGEGRRRTSGDTSTVRPVRQIDCWARIESRKVSQRKDSEMAAQERMNDDILDHAILWAPIGGPSSATIMKRFGIGEVEYRERLAAAIQLHEKQSADTSRAAVDRVYGPAVLAALRTACNHTQLTRAVPMTAA